MDQGTKEFIEASFEKWTGIVSSEIQSVRQEMKDMGKGLRGEMKDMETNLKKEISAVKQVVDRIDDRTQHQVEALYEEIRVTQMAVAKVEKHAGLPQSFPVAA